jgi:hypothetical protein
MEKLKNTTQVEGGRREGGMRERVEMNESPDRRMTNSGGCVFLGLQMVCWKRGKDNRTMTI